FTPASEPIVPAGRESRLIRIKRSGFLNRQTSYRQVRLRHPISFRLRDFGHCPPSKAERWPRKPRFRALCGRPPWGRRDRVRRDRHLEACNLQPLIAEELASCAIAPY